MAVTRGIRLGAWAARTLAGALLVAACTSSGPFSAPPRTSGSASSAGADTPADVGFMRAGDVVGELSLFSDRPRAATVEDVADQVLAFCGNQVSDADVAALLGVVDRRLIMDASRAVLSGDVRGVRSGLRRMALEDLHHSFLTTSLES